MRNPEYQFISTDTSALVAELIAAYEYITKTTIRPASPERLFIAWIADVMTQERALNNYTGNQNLPSRAEGQNLDALGELFYEGERPAAKAAKCTMRFHISAAQSTAILIPSGTRVTDASNTLVWATTADAYVAIGDTYVDIMVQCQTAGVVGNGYTAGQLSVIVDPYDYQDHCENTTESDGGADMADDDEYYKLMRASQDGHSTAGPTGGYIYLAKQVSTEIADVVPNTPSDGQVHIYVLMNDGTAAGTEIKNAVLAACSAKTARPLTDHVIMDDPDAVSYDITFTYYIPTNSPLSSAEIEAAVAKAVADYKAWQSAKLGRDINPSYLIGLLMKTGIKRVVLTAPAYTALNDGSDNLPPNLAVVGTVTVTNGGYEDE